MRNKSSYQVSSENNYNTAKETINLGQELLKLVVCFTMITFAIGMFTLLSLHYFTKFVLKPSDVAAALIVSFIMGLVLAKLMLWAVGEKIEESKSDSRIASSSTPQEKTLETKSNHKTGIDRNTESGFSYELKIDGNNIESDLSYELKERVVPLKEIHFVLQEKQKSRDQLLRTQSPESNKVQHLENEIRRLKNEQTKVTKQLENDHKDEIRRLEKKHDITIDRLFSLLAEHGSSQESNVINITNNITNKFDNSKVDNSKHSSNFHNTFNTQQNYYTSLENQNYYTTRDTLNGSCVTQQPCIDFYGNTSQSIVPYEGTNNYSSNQDSYQMKFKNNQHGHSENYQVNDFLSTNHKTHSTNSFYDSSYYNSSNKSSQPYTKVHQANAYETSWNHHINVL